MLRAAIVVGMMTIAAMSAYGVTRASAGTDNAAPAVVAGLDGVSAETPSERYYRAFELLDVDQRPGDAAPLFEAVAGDEGATRFLRARATAGWIRCELMLGHAGAAAELYDTLRREYADVPDAWIEVRGRVPRGRVATRFSSQIITLRDGQFLDLDTLAIFDSSRSPQGAAMELQWKGRVQWLSPAATVRRGAAIAAAMPWLSDGEWSETTTDQGRTAWLQTLRGRGAGVVRVVVRVAGNAAPIRAVGGLLCVGRQGGIDLHFEPRREFARYRIERADGPDGAFVEIGRVTRSPFRDDDAEEGRRLIYRVVGVSAEGDESVPAQVQGTVLNRGVYRGRIEFASSRAAPRGFDLVRRRPVASGGDLEFRSTYGGAGAAAFYDGFGLEVRGAWRPGVVRGDDGAGGDDRDDVWSRWQVPADAGWQIPRGGTFVLAIRGGGVAVCTWTSLDERGGARVDYTVYPDVDTVPAAPTLECAADPRGGVRIAVAVGEGVRVTKVTVEVLSAKGAPVDLPVRDGVAHDAGARDGEARRYRLEPIDALGRRLRSAEVVWNSLPGGMRAGRISLRPGEGYSFAMDAVVPPATADVFVEGSRRKTLVAAAGVTTLDALTSRQARRLGPHAASRWFDGLVAYEPRTAGWSGAVSIHDERPLSGRLFVMRARHGGHIKMLAEPSQGGDAVALRYVVNHHDPVFAEEPAERRSLGSARMDAKSIAD